MKIKTNKINAVIFKKIIFIKLLFFYCYSHAAIAKENDYSVAHIVGTYADLYELEYGDVLKSVEKSILNSRAIPKGGVGIIGRDLYVMLDRSKNTLNLNGNFWVGNDATKSEVVFSDGKKVSSNIQDIDSSKLIIVIFSKSEVRYVNYNRNSAGFYKRYYDVTKKQ